jgi:acetylornithine/succinyldiaminopimelate/putrescine aminotransferase
MVFVDFLPQAKRKAVDIVESAREQGILLRESADGSIRLVAHYWIDDEAVERLITHFQRLLG